MLVGRAGTEDWNFQLLGKWHDLQSNMAALDVLESQRAILYSSLSGHFGKKKNWFLVPLLVLLFSTLWSLKAAYNCLPFSSLQQASSDVSEAERVQREVWLAQGPPTGFR